MKVVNPVASPISFRTFTFFSNSCKLEGYFCSLKCSLFFDCVNMSDSDDFSDAGEEVPNEVNSVNNHVRRVNKNGVKVRGRDKDWVEVSRFLNAEINLK